MLELIPLVVIIPLAGGFAAPIVAKIRRGDRAALYLAMVVGILNMGLSIGFLFSKDPYVYWVGGWKVPLGISLVVDGFSRYMLLVVNLIGALVTIFSFGYMKRYTSPGLYCSLFMVMVAGMNGVVISGDLFNLFVFLEIASISSYALVAFGTRDMEVEASFKYLILGSLGSLFFLFGIGLIYNQTGQLNMARIASILAGRSGDPVVNLASAFFIMGVGLKAALVPFHAWLPDAHPAAPAPVSAMLSGVLIKVSGIYVICRLFFNVFIPTTEIIGILMALAALSMLVGGLLMIGQNDMKRLLAYCSIGQVGFIVGAISVSLYAEIVINDSALAMFALFGAFLHLFNHAIFKALLFLVAGSIEYRLNTRSLPDLGGLKQFMPITAACCRVGSLSISGIPPFAGFFGKVAVLLAMFQAGLFWLGIVAGFEICLTLLAFLKLQRAILEGKPRSLPADGIDPLPWSMRFAMVTLAAVCLVSVPIIVWLKSWVIDPASESLLRQTAGYAARFMTGVAP